MHSLNMAIDQRIRVNKEIINSMDRKFSHELNSNVGLEEDDLSDNITLLESVNGQWDCGVAKVYLENEE